VKPTVFVNVKNDMTIARRRFWSRALCPLHDSEDEAIKIANDSRYVSTRPSLGPTSSARV